MVSLTWGYIEPAPPRVQLGILDAKRNVLWDGVSMSYMF